MPRLYSHKDVLSRDAAYFRLDLEGAFVWSEFGRFGTQLAFVLHDDGHGRLLVKKYRRVSRRWTGPVWIGRQWLKDAPKDAERLCALAAPVPVEAEP